MMPMGLSVKNWRFPRLTLRRFYTKHRIAPIWGQRSGPPGEMLMSLLGRRHPDQSAARQVFLP
jgi:hypothetical protein